MSEGGCAEVRTEHLGEEREGRSPQAMVKASSEWHLKPLEGSEQKKDVI